MPEEPGSTLIQSINKKSNNPRFLIDALCP